MMDKANVRIFDLRFSVLLRHLESVITVQGSLSSGMVLCSMVMNKMDNMYLNVKVIPVPVIGCTKY